MCDPQNSLESRVARWTRPYLVFVIGFILLVHYGILSMAEAFLHVTYTHLTAVELGISVAPAMYYIFQRTFEKVKGLAS